MTDKVVSEKFVPKFIEDPDGLTRAIFGVRSELEKELNASEEVEEEMCAHSAQEGVGTKATGYALPEMGPFLCVNCVHASKNGTRCDHKEVIADPDVPKDGKLAVVHPTACCNEFHPIDTE